MKVREVMNPNVVAVTRDMSIRKLIMVLDEHRITGAPVVDEEGRIVGIVSGKDIISAIDQLIRVQLSIDEQKDNKGRFNWVEGIMTTEVVTTDEDADAREVFRTMVRLKIHRIPVVRDGKPVGMVSSLDACRLVSGMDELGTKA